MALCWLRKRCDEWRLFCMLSFVFLPLSAWLTWFINGSWMTSYVFFVGSLTSLSVTFICIVQELLFYMSIIGIEETELPASRKLTMVLLFGWRWEEGGDSQAISEFTAGLITCNVPFRTPSNLGNWTSRAQFDQSTCSNLVMAYGWMILKILWL